MQRHDGAPWIGPAIALCAASPAWLLFASTSPSVTPLSAAAACAWLTYAAISWIAVLTSAGDERWVSDEPTARSLGVWTTIGGYTAAPALVLGASVPVALLALVLLAVTVVLVSPTLSDLAGGAFDVVVVGREQVRNIHPVGGADHRTVAALEAVAAAGPGQLVPPSWHPCLGRP